MQRQYSDNFYDMDNGLMEYDEPSDYRPLEDIWDIPEEIDTDGNKLSLDEIIHIIDNELKKLEYNRDSIEFYYKDELVEAIPMAKIGKDAVVFKINNKLKKVKFEDIYFE